MSNYHWLLTVLTGNGTLDMAAMPGPAPDPGDLVLLEDGSIATVVTKSIFTDHSEEYQAAISFVKPKNVSCWYERKPVKEAADAPC